MELGDFGAAGRPIGKSQLENRLQRVSPYLSYFPHLLGVAEGYFCRYRLESMPLVKARELVRAEKAYLLEPALIAKHFSGEPAGETR